MRSRHEVPYGPALEAWLPRLGTTVLLLSTDTQLHGAVGRVCAAAAVELVIAQSLEGVAGRWDEVAAVLLGPDSGVAASGLAGWTGTTVLVGFDTDTVEIWRQAEQQGADRVAILPDSAQWLANHLGQLRNSAQGAGVVGVVAPSGGAGASALAVLLAAAASSRGSRTLLVDGDPWGGGLGTSLSAQSAPGLHWPDLLRASGSINPEQLVASLPQLGDTSLLTWNDLPQLGESAPPPAPVGEVMRAARAVYGLVVVDLARSPQLLQSLAGHCNGVVIILPARARSVAATKALMPLLPPLPVAAVVRGPLREGLDATGVAEAAGLPLLGQFPQLRGVQEALAAQRPTELLRRRMVRTLMANLLEWLAGAPSATTHVAGRWQQ